MNCRDENDISSSSIENFSLDFLKDSYVIVGRGPNTRFQGSSYTTVVSHENKLN
jgi:hypothetical protein